MNSKYQHFNLSYFYLIKFNTFLNTYIKYNNFFRGGYTEKTLSGDF